MKPTRRLAISVEVNGALERREVDARRLLVDFVRDELGLTGTHVGCDSGNCGACSVIVDGALVKSCMQLAAQADGSRVLTVESLARGGALSDLQSAFSEEHALQCGYCTPGMLMAATNLLESNPHPSEGEIREALRGNVCRCTGYVGIVRAILSTGRGG